MSKCTFGMRKVEYLEHIISKDGVSTDPSKMEAMVNWPVPQTMKELRGLEGLTGWVLQKVYQKLCISKPLKDQLKIDGFQWNESAQQAFERLKKAMTSAPV